MEMIDVLPEARAKSSPDLFSLLDTLICSCRHYGGVEPND